MASTRSESAASWTVSTLASSLVGGIAVLVFAILVLPIDQNFWWLNATVVAAGIIACVVFRRHWHLVALGACLLSLASGVFAPLWLERRDVYVVECDITDFCWSTVSVTSSGRDAKIYPATDPIKLWLWRALGSDNDRFRFLHVGRTANERLLIHSPTERALATLSANQQADPYVSYNLSGEHESIILNVSRRAGRTEMAFTVGSGFGTILSPDIPVRDDVPGIFTAVGSEHSLIELTAEAVVADLSARALLSGRWREVLQSAYSQRHPSPRELARRMLIENAVLDISLEGRAVSVLRLIAIRRAMATIVALQQEAQGDDALLFELVAQTHALVRFPARTGAVELNVDPYEMQLFAADVRALAHLDESLRAARDPALRERAENGARMFNEWAEEVSNLRSPRDFARELTSRTDAQSDPLRYPPFDERTFDETALREAVANAAGNTNATAQVLFSATRILERDVIGRYTGMMARMLGGADELQAKFTTSQRQVMVAVVLHAAPRLSPVVREVIVSRAQGILSIDRKTNTLLRVMREIVVNSQGGDPDDADSADLYARLSVMVPDEQARTMLSGMLRETPQLSAISEAQPVACVWFDRDLGNQFSGLFIAAAVGRSNDTLASGDYWTDLVRRTYAAFGEGGRCPEFVPGVALLHFVLMRQQDQRSAETRRTLDRLVGADPGWLLAANENSRSRFESVHVLDRPVERARRR